MDQNEAINQFVSSNFKLILAKEFSGVVYKRAKSDFFLAKLKLSGVPKDKLIAEHAINFLIKNGAISDDQKLSEILCLPFFRDNVHNKEQFVEILHLEKSTINIIDPKQLSLSKYRNKVRTEIESEVIRESKDKIAKAIEEKKEEYELVPSVLDGTDFAEPIPEEKVEQDDEKFVPWWRRLKLSQDPFPTQEGLSLLADSLYEKIVFKTPIFEKYVYLANSEPGELFKDTIFFGDFGSGKTTLFDYLKKPLVNERIFTIYIQLYAEQSFQTLLTNFRKKLFEGLCEKYQMIFRSDPCVWLGSIDFQEGIEKLLNKFSGHEDVKGFVIIIDDLHKDIQTFELAMKFVNNLQIFKGELMRKININITFFVAGSSDWEKIIKNDSKYSGSYARQETMPPVTEDAAYEMLNKRLAAFATNPETIRSIDLDFVKRIYRGLENNKLPITFRSFIKAALTEFGNGNFSILTVDPVHISKDVLTEIRNVLELSTILKKKFDNLLYSGGIQKEENRRRSLELLVLTYLKGGIAEDSRELRENQFGFQRLIKSQLIQKMRLLGGKFKWVICQELNLQNHLVLKQFNLSIEDYLIKVYSKPTPIKTKKIEKSSEEIKILDSIIKRLANSHAKTLAKAARSKHINIIKETQRFERSIPNSEAIVKDCVESLALVTKSLASFLSLKVQLVDDLTFLTEFWKDFWVHPGEISELINQVTKREKECSDEQVWYISSLYSEAFPVLLKLFDDELDKARYMVIPLSGLSNEEIVKVREIREKWAENNFFDVAGLTSAIIEKKLRVFLYNIFNLLFGDRENRLRNVDSTTREYILQNIRKDQEKGLGLSGNEFVQVNRGNYKNFMIGSYGSTIGKQNWDSIFKRALSPLSESELKQFLDIFADIDIATSHFKEGSITAEQQSGIFSFVLRSLDFIRKINAAYLMLLQNCFYVIETGGSPRFAYYFSFDELKNKNRLSPSYVKPSNADRIVEQLVREKPLVTIDLQGSQTIESRYGVAYREFMTIISRLIKQTQGETEKSGVEIKVEKDNGSAITLFVTDTKLREHVSSTS